MAPMRHLILIFILTLSATGHTAESRIVIKGVGFNVDLAITESEQRHGLMEQTELKKDQGMLFVYSEPQQLSFWMKKTLIPLDILFFDRDGKLLEFFSDVPPCKKEPCKTYSNRTPALYVLELPAGSAKKLELKRGDRFLHASTPG
jgi:uncharacterized membrane protein (UPF0127 family)